MNDGDTYFVTPSARPAAGFRLAQTDPMAVAAAERMRPVASEANIGDSKVSLLYDQTPTFSSFTSGTDIRDLGNALGTAAAVATTASNIKPAFVIPKGADNVSLMMEVPLDSNLSFQVMTHEGVHVLGHSIDTATQAALVSGDAAFSATNSYSSTYLNAVGTAAYLDTDMTYGFLAKSIEQSRAIRLLMPSGTGMVAQTTLTANAQVDTAPVSASRRMRQRHRPSI